MKSISALLALALLCNILHAQAKKELQTEITRVTVFSIGAQIHRTGSLELAEGKTMIRLTGLTPDLDPKSIQVKGNDNFTILSVSHEWNTSTGANSNKTIDSLSIVFNKLDWLTRTLRMRRDVLDQKLVLLNQNGKINGGTGGVTADQLESTLLFFETTIMQANREQLDIFRQLDSLEKLKMVITQQISIIRGTPLTSKSEIEILVRTDHPTSAHMEISYIVRNAGWIPRYDIRAKDISKPIVVVYKADVHQQTGEIWKNVKLTFSNASPYERQTAPELGIWKLTTLSNTTFKRIGPPELNYGNRYTYGTRMVTGNIRDKTGEALIFANVNVAGHNLGTQTDLDGNFSILLPADASTLNITYTGYQSKSVPVTSDHLNVDMEGGMELESVVITGLAGRTRGYDISQSQTITKPMDEKVVIIDNQVSVEFELEDTTTILSDGKNSSLELQTYEIPADYHYETAPKIDHGAYLIATLTNWEKYHLIEGQANLYFNNTFIGKTILDPVNLSDTLEISLGRDPEVLAERIKEEEFTKKTFLGANTIIEKSFKLTFRNKKQYSIHIMVSDQVPVSVHDDINVTVTQISGGSQDENSGIVRWDIQIDPVENQELILAYAVKYPSKERVVLEK